MFLPHESFRIEFQDFEHYKLYLVIDEPTILLS